MTMMVLGLALWWAGHLFKRMAPASRAALTDKMGEASKGVIAAVLAVSVVLMVLGYRGADVVAVWTPPGWTVHLNNLLMLVAIALFGMGSSKGRMRSWFRHPMLMGMATWAGAHLLVNGDFASMFLFGSLGIWALATIAIVNLSDPAWDRPKPGPAKGDIRLGVITLVLFGVIAGIHSLIGPWPFPS